MNDWKLLGYLVAFVLAPIAPFLLHRWLGAAWQAVKALRVLLRERRTGETLYDAAEALAGDAHNWRGMTSPIGCAGDVVNDSEESGLAAAVKRIRAERIASVPQPPPRNSDGPALWTLIISELGDSETDRLVAVDMQQRHEFGVAKYGVPLVASNGRDHLADAYQESLDCVVYLRAAFDYHASATHEATKSGAVNDLGVLVNDLGDSRVRQLYIDMLDAAKEIRELIRERDGR